MITTVQVHADYGDILATVGIHHGKTEKDDIRVRYHCGGWSEELNSRVLLLALMVYLQPKHSLGY